MKIYGAGYVALKGRNLENYARLTRHRLISLEYYKDIGYWVDVCKKLGHTADFIVDSGAYSAWRKGKSLDLKELVKKVEEVRALGGELFKEFHLINADVIPGIPKTPPTWQQVQDSAEASFQNWKMLRGLGIDTLPVHHQAEELHLIDRYVGEGAEYICFSPANDKSPKSKKSYCEDAFSHTARNGHKVRVHALGVTSWDLLEAFPWYSVDSMTTGINAKYGKVWVLLNNRPVLIGITERLLPRGGKMHTDLMTGYERGLVGAWIGRFGLTIEQLIESMDLRMLVSCCTFACYEDVLNRQPFGDYRVEVADETDV